MGRLFWKFFLFLWLAQLFSVLAVSLAIWQLHSEHRPPPFDHPQPAPGMSAMPFPAEPPGFGLPPEGVPPPPPPHDHLPPWAIPLGAGSIISVLFAALLAWYFSRPIRTLQRAFDAVAEGRLDTRIGVAMGRRKDELADLSLGFDHMAERLEGLIEGQRRLLHDVSHELRSPLARLQAVADLMRQQPERAQELIQHIERDTSRMDGLIGELLTLARLDAGMGDSLRDTLDLAQLVSGITEDAELEAEPRRCRVEVSLPEALTVRGNGDLIHRAIENVVRNALRHSPEGGVISVAVEGDSARGWAQIEVMDQGPGVPETDLEHLFEPFRRSANAGKSAGFGLGLAITRRVMETHGGTARASNRGDGGLRVCLRMPTHSAEPASRKPGRGSAIAADRL